MFVSTGFLRIKIRGVVSQSPPSPNCTRKFRCERVEAVLRAVLQAGEVGQRAARVSLERIEAVAAVIVQDDAVDDAGEGLAAPADQWPDRRCGISS